MYIATLKKVYHNTGARGGYLSLVMAGPNGEGVRANLFDQWYFQAGTPHDITQHLERQVEYEASVVEKQTPDGPKQYVNVSRIQPVGQIWEKPPDGMAPGGHIPGAVPGALSGAVPLAQQPLSTSAATPLVASVTPSGEIDAALAQTIAGLERLRTVLCNLFARS